MQHKHSGIAPLTNYKSLIYHQDVPVFQALQQNYIQHDVHDKSDESA